MYIYLYIYNSHELYHTCHMKVDKKKCNRYTYDLCALYITVKTFALVFILLTPFSHYITCTYVLCTVHYTVLYQAGISLQEERDFIACLRTRNLGQGVIILTAKCPPGVCSPNEATFYNEVQELIFARLKFLNPPNGHFLLPQNRYFIMMYLITIDQSDHFICSLKGI